MDAQKFGAFVAERRKEKNMTQADLAAKLQVIDKAVSRWERGLGFPDINTIEPLADALGLSVLELMKSEKMDEMPVSRDIADTAILDTLDVAAAQRREERKKVFSILGISLAAVLPLLVIDSAGWEVSAIVFFVFGVILPLFGALICFLIAVLPYVLAVILVMLGGFPVPN